MLIRTLLLLRGGTASSLLCISSSAILPPRGTYVLGYCLHRGKESIASRRNTGDAGVLTAPQTASHFPLCGKNAWEADLLLKALEKAFQFEP